MTVEMEWPIRDRIQAASCDRAVVQPGLPLFSLLSRGLCLQSMDDFWSNKRIMNLIS